MPGPSLEPTIFATRIGEKSSFRKSDNRQTAHDFRYSKTRLTRPDHAHQEKPRSLNKNTLAKKEHVHPDNARTNTGRGATPTAPAPRLAARSRVLLSEKAHGLASSLLENPSPSFSYSHLFLSLSTDPLLSSSLFFGQHTFRQAMARAAGFAKEKRHQRAPRLGVLKRRPNT